MVETKFKDTDVGRIPNDWNVDIIDNIAVITTGSQNTQDNNPNGIYPFYVRSQKVERINKWIFDTEGVVTAGDGVGTGRVFHYVKGKFGLHQRCYLIYNFVPQVDTCYFYWVFSNSFFERVKSMTAKSSVDSVRREMIAGMKVPLPAKPEQTRIAETLTSIDKLISELGKLIDKKKDIKQGTMQQLLSGKKRLKGFSEPWVEKKMWEVTTWDKRFSGVPSYMQSKSIKYPYVLANVFDRLETSGGNVLLLSTGNYVGWTTEEKAGQNLCEGEIVAIPWGGKANVKYAKGKFVTADNRIATSSDSSILNNKFLYYLMLYREKEIDALYRGASIKHPSMLDVLSMTLNLPSVKEQSSIANVLSSMDDEIASLEAKRNKYIAIKQGMMQQLLTGKIRLI